MNKTENQKNIKQTKAKKQEQKILEKANSKNKVEKLVKQDMKNIQPILGKLKDTDQKLKCPIVSNDPNKKTS